MCYRYFPSKEDIYDAALEKYADLIARENLRWTDAGMSIREMIDTITGRVGLMRNAEREDRELYALFHSPNSRRMHDELFLRVTKKVMPYVQARLRRAKENGEIAIEDTDGVAIIGVYGWVGLHMTDSLTDEERMEKARSAWYRLLEL